MFTTLTVLSLAGAVFSRSPIYWGDTTPTDRPSSQHILGSVDSQQIINSSPSVDDVKVPVQLGVMSKCPDALLCESVFDEVVRQHGVWDKVDLELVYIAKWAPILDLY